jgi:protoporphyrinogen oxidase
MELTKAGKTATVIERDTKVGGLAQTLVFKEGDLTFRTDIGPHRFFSKNKYLYDFIEGLLHEKWIQVPRQTRQLIEGKYYDYPIRALQAFKNIGPFRAARMVLSYLHALYVYRLCKKPIHNFEDYIVANFGKELGDFNMLNYTEKIWGLPCSKLHADWARQRIKGLSLRTAVINALFKKQVRNGPKTLVDTFYYPQFGAGLVYETIADKITQAGSTLLFNHMPTKVRHEGGRITAVEVTNGTETFTHHPEYLVSSIPITMFLSQLDPAPPREVLDAASALSWRGQVYLFITLDRPSITNDNWIYIPDRDIPMGRLSEMRNFSKDMAPEGKTSMFVEYFVNQGDAVWNMSEDDLFELTMRDVERLKLFSRREVRKYYQIKRPYVYPVYDLAYPEHLKIIKAYLDTLENLYYIGRPGRFKYNNQDHSLEMGIAAAKGILAHARPNFDHIGAESEYFEEGELKASAS